MLAPVADIHQVEARLAALLRTLRAKTPKRPSGETLEADLDLSRVERQGGELLPRAVITLRGVGCGWARHKGGCTMCGHDAGSQNGEAADTDALIAQFDRAFAQVDWSGFPILCLYNGGSILNPDELPEAALAHILQRIKATPGIAEVVVETRAQFVNEQRLGLFTSHLGSRKLRVAMGLESANEEVRALSVHKGFSLAGFERACKLVRHAAKLRLYVLIKPPWLTEAEMIDDAVATIRLAKTLGASDIHFEPLTIQRHTLLSLLWRQEKYRLPWLWSVVEVLKRVSPTSVYVSPFAHFPRPIAIPHNCGRCDDNLRALLIDRYDRQADIGVFAEARCECQADWREELAQRDPRPLVLRVAEDLPGLERALEELHTPAFSGAPRSEMA